MNKIIINKSKLNKNQGQACDDIYLLPTKEISFTDKIEFETSSNFHRTMISLFGLEKQCYSYSATERINYCCFSL